MAVATYTCSIYKTMQAKALTKGDQSISGKIVYSGTVADILFLAKVPHGATIVDFYEYHTSGSTGLGISFGFDRGVVDGGAGNQSCLVSSGALATMNRMSLANWPVASNYPPTLSLSDLDTIRYVRLVAVSESGTTTISASIMFTLIYRMDGPQPAPPGAQADTP